MDNLDFFTPPPGNDDLVRKFYVDYRPISAWRSGSPLEFHIPGTMPYLISLKDTRLCTSWTVSTETKGHVTSTTGNMAGPINLCHQTMWKDVDIQLQHHITRSSGNMYAYRAYMEALLSEDEKAPQTQFWFPDEPNRFDISTTPADIAALKSAHTDSESSKAENDRSAFVAPVMNRGFNERYKSVMQGMKNETEGSIHHDLCQQNRPLLNNIDMVVQFWPSNNDFVMMKNSKFRINIEKATLRVCYLELTKSALNAIENQLAKRNARYPLQRVVTKNHTLPGTATSFTFEDMYHGEVPSCLIVGLVDTKAFTGDASKNPFNFKQYSLRSIGFYVNGESVPQPPIETEYRGSNDVNYTAGYNSLALVLNRPVPLTVEEWAEGSTLYGFAIAGRDETVKKHGHTRLEIQLNRPSSASKTLITYAVFPGNMEITKNRQIIEN